MHIGEKIKLARESVGMSAAELSRQANIHQPYLCIIEQGKAIGLKVRQLERICKALGVSPDELMEWEEREKTGSVK